MKKIAVIRPTRTIGWAALALVLLGAAGLRTTPQTSKASTVRKPAARQAEMQVVVGADATRSGKRPGVAYQPQKVVLSQASAHKTQSATRRSQLTATLAQTLQRPALSVQRLLRPFVVGLKETTDSSAYFSTKKAYSVGVGYESNPVALYFKSDEADDLEIRLATKVGIVYLIDCVAWKPSGDYLWEMRTVADGVIASGRIGGDDLAVSYASDREGNLYIGFGWDGDPIDPYWHFEYCEVSPLSD